MNQMIEKFPEPSSPVSAKALAPYSLAERKATEFSIEEKPAEKIARIALEGLIDIKRFDMSATKATGKKLKDSGHFDRLIEARHHQVEWYVAEYDLNYEEVMIEAKSSFDTILETDIDI